MVYYEDDILIASLFEFLCDNVYFHLVTYMPYGRNVDQITKQSTKLSIP